MFFLVQSLLSFVIEADFLFEEFEKKIEIQSKAVDMILFDKNFWVVTSDLPEAQVLVVSENFEKIALVVQLKGKNEYRPVKILRNSTFVMLVVNVVVSDVKEIPGVKEQLVIHGTKEQVFLFIIDPDTFTIREAVGVGQCLTGNKTAFDAQVYGSAVLITGKSTCSNQAELDVVGRNTIQLDFLESKFSAFIINDFLYLVSDSSQLSLSKFDLYLTQVWSTFITTSQLVDLIVQDTFFYILTKSSLFKIDENGKIVNTQFFSSKVFTKFILTNSGFYLLSQQPLRTLTWLAMDMKENSERQYSNVSRFYSIEQFNSSDFFMLLETSPGLKTEVWRSIQPFSQSHCHRSCLSCFGTSNSSCFTCRFYRTETTCGTCHESCADCFGPLQSNCYSCNPGFVLYEQKCFKNLSCPSGTFQNFLREKCQACDLACETCKGTSFNDCLKCKTGFLSDLNSCVLTCPDGKYPDKGVCKICEYPCAKCSSAGSDSCIECRPGYLLFESTCLESCPEKTWKNGGLCINCNENCRSCISSECFTCEDRYYNAQGKCLPCTPGCQSCISSDCLTCDEGLISISGSCSARCEEGFYSSLSSCLPCDATCKTCSGPLYSNCTSCESSSLLFESTCIDVQSGCPSSYFEFSGVCRKCPENCLECVDQSTCQYCKKAYALNDGKCEECQEADCECPEYCDNCRNGVCFKCTSRLVLHFNECLEKCPEGFFEAHDTCLCRESCKECEGSSCLQCMNGFFNINGTCIPCSRGCSACASESECLFCSSQKFLINGKCEEDCPAGFMQFNQTCLKCPDRCKKCQVSGCSECFEDFSNNGFYELVNQSCLPSLTCIAGHVFSPGSLKCEKSFKSSLLNFLKSFL